MCNNLLIVLITIFLSTSLWSQNQIKIDDLTVLIGSWKSQLDEKYKDHPRIKKVNSELKGHLTVFEWGVDKKIIHLSVYYLDRPNIGDTIKFIEGMIIPNPATGELKMIEYNAESDIYFEGDYQLDEYQNIIRHYEVGFSNGTSTKFKEQWIWRDKSKKSFEWHTAMYKDGVFQEGDIIVNYNKIE